MTIATSKQLAEALGPKWTNVLGQPPKAGYENVCVEQVSVLPLYVARPWDPEHLEVFSDDPRAAVLALADRLEAEARALRESIKEGP